MEISMSEQKFTIGHALMMVAALLSGLVLAAMTGCRSQQTDLHVGVVVQPPYDREFGDTKFEVKVIKTYR
jgi:hypothetical protein